MGAWCRECNSWISWITYDEMMKLYKELENEQDLGDKITLRKVHKKKNTTVIECSRCGCLLYNSCKPRVQGQFDLVMAKFCPQCGRELI